MARPLSFTLSASDPSSSSNVDYMVFLENHEFLKTRSSVKGRRSGENVGEAIMAVQHVSLQPPVGTGVWGESPLQWSASPLSSCLACLFAPEPCS